MRRDAESVRPELKFLYPNLKKHSQPGRTKTMSREHDTHYIGHERRCVRATSKSTYLSVLIFALSMHLAAQALATTLWVDHLAASPPPGSGCGLFAGYNTISAAVAAAS